MIWGFWPGAWVRLITVNDDTWATDLTVAALIHGAPITPHIRLMKFTRTISKWKPLPFWSLRSFLAIISLWTHRVVSYIFMLYTSYFTGTNTRVQIGMGIRTRWCGFPWTWECRLVLPARWQRRAPRVRRVSLTHWAIWTTHAPPDLMASNLQELWAFRCK